MQNVAFYSPPHEFLSTQVLNALELLKETTSLTSCILPQATRPGLLEAWLVLTSVKYHENLYILIPLNQRLALTRLRATGPRSVV